MLTHVPHPNAYYHDTHHDISCRVSSVIPHVQQPKTHVVTHTTGVQVSNNMEIYMYTLHTHTHRAQILVNNGT